MAYEFTTVKTLETLLDGLRYVQYQITETDISPGPGNEWKIDATDGGSTPQFYTISLIEADLTVPGSASTIQTEVGKTAVWVTDETGHIDRAVDPGAHIRIGQNKRVTQTISGALFGRSNVDIATGATGVIVTLVTMVWGHGV